MTKRVTDPGRDACGANQFSVLRNTVVAKPGALERLADLRADTLRRSGCTSGAMVRPAFHARSDDEVLDLGEDRLDAFATLLVLRLAPIPFGGLAFYL